MNIPFIPKYQNVISNKKINTPVKCTETDNSWNKNMWTKRGGGMKKHEPH